MIPVVCACSIFVQTIEGVWLSASGHVAPGWACFVVCRSRLFVVVIDQQCSHNSGDRSIKAFGYSVGVRYGAIVNHSGF